MALARAVAAPTKRARASRKLHVVPETGVAPRIAPPRPTSSLIADLRKASKVVGRKFYGWQDLAGEYMTATRRGRWLFPEFAVIVSRQNGKTGLLVPRIVMGLLSGERIMMTAQDRQLIVRDVFGEVADVMEGKFSAAMKGGARRANGQEQITMLNGGRFRIVAPTRGGARGPANDTVIIDEVREMHDFDFIAAAKPTMTVSKRPQIIYLSNAGDEASIVLNALRDRAALDPTLGYLEWSAHPDRPIDDRTGWREANPRLVDGDKSGDHWSFLEREYKANHAQGTDYIFETEHLCRSVPTLKSRLASDAAWQNARRDDLPAPVRPAMGVAVDPDGRRASAVLAWMVDGIINLHLLADHPGYPVDLDAVAKGMGDEPGLLAMQRKLGIKDVGFDPWTDRELARHFKEPKQINGQDWRSASERFARALEAGQVRHDDREELTGDMAHTVRHETTHGWIAVPASPDRPTTASLAAIRAVWLATAPGPTKPRVL